MRGKGGLGRGVSSAAGAAAADAAAAGAAPRAQLPGAALPRATGDTAADAIELISSDEGDPMEEDEDEEGAAEEEEEGRGIQRLCSSSSPGRRPAAAAADGAAGGGPAAARAPGAGLGGLWQVWEVDLPVSNDSLDRRRLHLPPGLLAAVTSRAGPPPALRVALFLDGAQQGAAVEGEARAYSTAERGAAVRGYLYLKAQALPLPRGCRVARFVRVGATAVEVHATGRPAAANGAEGAAGRQAGAASLLEVQARGGEGAAGEPRGAEDAALAAAEPAGMGGPPAPQQQQTAAGDGGGVPPQALAAAAASGAPAAAAAASRDPAAEGAPAAAAPAAEDFAAALRALQLAALDCPAAEAPRAALALEEVLLEAYEEVELVAEALGLPPAAVDAVCSGLVAATEEGLAAWRFLRMEYPWLVQAAAAGEVGVVRAWLERVAARQLRACLITCS